VALPQGAQARLDAADAALPAAARLAAAAQAGGDAQDTLGLSRAAVAAAPQDHALRLSMAILQVRLGADATAMATAAPALPAAAADPALADRVGMLGDALGRNGSTAEAAALLATAWRASPRPAMIRSLLAAGLPAYRRSLNEGADAALLDAMIEAAQGAVAALPEPELAELARLAEDAGREDAVRALGLAALAAGLEGRARAVAGMGGVEAMAAGLALLATGRGAQAGIAFEMALAADPAARASAAWAALAAGEAGRAEALLAALPACGAAAMARAAWPCFGELPWPFGTPPAAPPAPAAWPRIRLVTPCFNPGPWLEETILSVAAQDYPAVEHVVVDACSTDGTAEILARHRHRLHAVIVEPDSGPAEAILKGLRDTDAELLGWINADDLLAPGALRRMGAAFAADPAADIVHGYALPHRARRLLGVHRALPAGPQGFATAGLADVFGRWVQGDFFLQPEALVARRFWESIGGRLDTSLAAAFDYEMWLRAAAARPRILSVPWPVAFYRLHAAQRSGGRAALAAEQVAVRDRFAAPAPPPARLRAIRDGLRAAFARPPVRLLLIDGRGVETMPADERAQAVAALAAEGVALEIEPRLPADATACDLVVRLLRAHDGAEWACTLRAAGFAGPLVGWLMQDDRDPAANQDIARGMDIVVPSRAARRSALLQEAALVLPALPAPGTGDAAPPLAERLQALVAALRRAAQG
jgi:tetratricopeptide (TPR) repeat protein